MARRRAVHNAEIRASQWLSHLWSDSFSGSAKHSPPAHPASENFQRFAFDRMRAAKAPGWIQPAFLSARNSLAAIRIALSITARRQNPAPRPKLKRAKMQVTSRCKPSTIGRRQSGVRQNPAQFQIIELDIIRPRHLRRRQTNLSIFEGELLNGVRPQDAIEFRAAASQQAVTCAALLKSDSDESYGSTSSGLKELGDRRMSKG